MRVAAATTTKSQPVQGVYLLQADHKKLRAVFVPVTTGITGATDIEVLSGLKEGDEIVTGRYKFCAPSRAEQPSNETTPSKRQPQTRINPDKFESEL